MLLIENNNEYVEGRYVLNGKQSHVRTTEEGKDSPTA